MEERLSPAGPGYLSRVALAEIASVLQRTYRVGSDRLAAILEKLLQADRLVVDREQAVFAAICALREGRAGFADAPIGALGDDASCHCTLTFDRRAVSLAGSNGLGRRRSGWQATGREMKKGGARRRRPSRSGPVSGRAAQDWPSFSQPCSL